MKSLKTAGLVVGTTGLIVNIVIGNVSAALWSIAYISAVLVW